MKRGTGKRLLFVYDDALTVETFKSHFAVLGYEVSIADSISKAKELCLTIRPQVVVSDAVFFADRTDRSVEELLDFIQAEVPATKVIIATAYLPWERMPNLESRVHGILLKPISMETLTHTIESAFGIRKAIPGEEMTVRPIWRGRGFGISKGKCFVLMPFGESWSNRIWERHLKQIIAKCGFEPQRADDFTGHDVMEDIWRGLNAAEVVVADITGCNPNVFYELGVAHTLGKEIILLAQGLARIPFDVNRYRIIAYSDNSDGYDQLDQSLARVLDSFRNRVQMPPSDTEQDDAAYVSQPIRSETNRTSSTSGYRH